MYSAAENEISLGKDELIITKTDIQGKITYANRVFMRVANYSEQDLLGHDHNIIRHPDMPRGVFYGLWKTLKSGSEFFGFIKNYTADKNYYWVFANVTPDYLNHKVAGFFSVRRYAPGQAKDEMIDIYRQMLEQERAVDRSRAPEASWLWMNEFIQSEYQMGYEEFVLRLYDKHQRGGE
ncbi:PAS domain-containing protein [Vibrio quintilis]|uniref:Aerotaxis receptor n=1 Tax=Vibrio quintilis TaxID=1117707 RepID=A0A1M7YWL8_9VIBR|nr:PAS domain-containing protein [Vibrio quintilis]SHO56886.1 Aerotaxis receptor [Vibrio quintilis]